MTIKEIASLKEFKTLYLSEDSDTKEIQNIYCCDLLSICMSRMPEKALWITVMSNLNTLAVAQLTDVSCIILAEGAEANDSVTDKAKELNITLLSTELPVFDAAKLADSLM